MEALLAQRLSANIQSPRRVLVDLLRSPLRTGTSKPARTDSEFRCLTLSSVRHGEIDFNASKPVDLSSEESEKSQVRAGAFYVVRGNGNKNLVGRGGLAPASVPCRMAFPDLLFEVVPDETLLRPDYLRWVWDSVEVRRQIEDASATAAGIYKINQRNLGAISLPLPPIADQARIAERLARESTVVRALRTRLKARLADLDLLPAALMRDAFGG